MSFKHCEVQLLIEAYDNLDDAYKTDETSFLLCDNLNGAAKKVVAAIGVFKK